MRHMNKIAFRIFVSVLSTGIIGIIGLFTMALDINQMSAYYEQIADEHFTNREYMQEITSALYEHQSVVACRIVAIEDRIEYFDAREQELREALVKKISEFGERMKGDVREQLYHKLYSNFYSYLRNSDTALQLSAEEHHSTAGLYLTANMTEFAEKINGNLAELDELTVQELDALKKQMNQKVFMSRINAAVCTVIIIGSVTFCLFYCVKITLGLEHYKDDLEREVASQTKEIREHMEKMERIQNNTIIGMANLIESRDGDTGGHIKRTAIYVELLARAAKEQGYFKETLTDEYIELLVKAAPMHDIGKIAVPDNILKKPGKLTLEEFERIKSHAPEGGRIVREVLGNIEEKEYVDIASKVAAGHHEKWDGSGYPEGLKGEEIPLCARIMALADVFDALVSPRCYKASFPSEKAFGIIKESAGTHFDPTLAKIFIGLKPNILKVLDAEKI